MQIAVERRRRDPGGIAPAPGRRRDGQCVRGQIVSRLVAMLEHEGGMPIVIAAAQHSGIEQQLSP